MSQCLNEIEDAISVKLDIQFKKEIIIDNIKFLLKNQNKYTANYICKEHSYLRCNLIAICNLHGIYHAHVNNIYIVKSGEKFFIHYYLLYAPLDKILNIYKLHKNFINTPLIDHLVYKELGKCKDGNSNKIIKYQPKLVQGRLIAEYPEYTKAIKKLFPTDNSSETKFAILLADKSNIEFKREYFISGANCRVDFFADNEKDGKIVIIEHDGKYHKSPKQKLKDKERISDVIYFLKSRDCYHRYHHSDKYREVQVKVFRVLEGDEKSFIKKLPKIEKWLKQNKPVNAGLDWSADRLS